MTGVKLQIYEIHSKKVFVDSIEANDFGEFLIVYLNNAADYDVDNINEFSQTLHQAFPDKKVLLIPDNLDLQFYGIKDNDS